jgi:hypothetical protein
LTLIPNGSGLAMGTWKQGTLADCEALETLLGLSGYTMLINHLRAPWVRFVICYGSLKIESASVGSFCNFGPDPSTFG